MQIKVNGSALSISATCTVADLLTQLDMAQGRVAVEINRDIIPRSLHVSHQLQDGDHVEIVHAIGGG